MVRHARQGFTLIEAIAAVVILGVAIPPMLWAVQEAQAHRLTPLMVTTARWLAAEKLEDVIADRFSPTRGYDYVIAANYPAEAAVASFPAFRRTVTIAETGADLVSPGTGYKTVTVQLTWTDAMRVSRTFTLKTVLTKYN